MILAIAACPQCKKSLPGMLHYPTEPKGCYVKLGYSKERGQSWLRVWKPNGR